MLVIERPSFKTKDKKHSIDYATIYVILPCQGNKPYFVLYNFPPQGANLGKDLFCISLIVSNGFPTEITKKESRVQIAFRLSNIFTDGNLLMLSKCFIIFEIIHLFTVLFTPQRCIKWNYKDD